MSFVVIADKNQIGVIKFTSVSKQIISLHSQGKSNEEIIHIISEEWDIQDRIKIIRMIDYAIGGR